jgi:FkbM family methyltransferase
MFLATLPAALAGRLRAWRVTSLIRTFPVHVVEHTYGTGTLKVYLADPLAQGWYDHDWCELPEVTALRGSRLRPGARVFDLGAHQGIVALMLAREVEASGSVVAVEANPHNAMAAAKNRELNKADHITVIQAAVSDCTGTVVFNQGLNGQLDDGSGSGGRFNVESTTVDALAERFGMPDVVFIDVEGAECKALAGASCALASGADFFVEVHVGCGLEKLGGSVERVLSHFRQRGFTLLARAEAQGAFRPLVEDDAVTTGRFFLLALAEGKW